MKVEEVTLEQIANSIVSKLKRVSLEESKALLQMNNYHGFLKSRIPLGFLEEILSPFNLTSEDVQIEIVKVETDLSKEIHYHENSYAYVVCLGEEHRTDNPVNARAFLKDKWSPVKSGDVVRIPPKTPHGFTVDDGILVFLSVQAPPIEKGGNDDYHKVQI